ncbi:Bug family tripartite tricarboxylate transporter substrate binding protein [Roseomonas sp. CCTCC AB2023176]|uniref:Bug family tripartite tricarboxylate transporter substrate binding protein n=1 Tax=Roseomonas sp. CCTCC AB2023176 TaxID=3342640 RepID=UPI0035E2CD1B
MTGITRRAALALPALLPMAARAQGSGWRPDKPMRLIVGFAAGGSADFAARVVGMEMSHLLGQQVVIENRTGASGNLATQAVTSSPADGATIGLAGLQLAVNPALIARLGYDPATDLQMVSQITAVPVRVFASAKSGIRTLPELVERSKRDDGPLIACGGYGTSSFIGPEKLIRAAGGRYQPVLFRGGAPAFQAVLSGDCDAMVDIAASYHIPAAQQGQIRILTVLQDTREAALPDVPAVSEFGLGPDVQFRSWQGLFVRAGTPAPVVEALHAATQTTLRTPDLVRRFNEVGVEAAGSASPAAFQSFYISEMRRWTEVIRTAGIRPE